MHVSLFAIGFYWLATFALIQGLHASVTASADPAQRNPANLASRIWPFLAIIAISVHAFVHGIVIKELGGADLHFFSALSLVSLGMAILTLLFARDGKMASAGIFVFPVASVALLACEIAGHPKASPIIDWQLQLHAWIALLSYATLAFAALFAVMLWLQERALQRRQWSHALRSLPPLVTLETMLFRTIKAGFILLTLTLITGIVFVSNLFEQHLAHKTFFSIISWLTFAALLFGRMRYGWRGAKAVRWTLIAFAFLALSFFGVMYATEFVFGSR